MGYVIRITYRVRFKAKIQGTNSDSQNETRFCAAVLWHAL